MNLLSIDYGTKRIGLAVSISGIIEPITAIPNDTTTLDYINKIVDTYRINKIYVGISQGPVAKETLLFVNELKHMLQLPIETIEEAVSTIEAFEIYKTNKKKKKNYKKDIDSVAAAVILRRIVD